MVMQEQDCILYGLEWETGARTKIAEIIAITEDVEFLYVKNGMQVTRHLSHGPWLMDALAILQ